MTHAASVRQSLVTHNRRNMAAIRVEVVAAAKNFLEERLCDEQQRVMTHFKHILEANSSHDLIAAGMPLIEDLFPQERRAFADSVCELFMTTKPMN